MSAPPIPAGHLEHRQVFWDFVLSQGERWHREHLRRLIGEWETYNVAHFEARLAPPIILLTEPSAPSIYGDCAPVGSYGARSEIRLRPSLLAGTHPHINAGAPPEGRFLFVADVLLHETIHQWHQEVTGIREDDYHGHGPVFRDTCNVIGATLGLPPVRTSKKRGKDAHLPSCSQWPHNVRAADFYLNAYHPPVPASGDVLEAALRRLVARYGATHVRQILDAIRGDA